MTTVKSNYDTNTGHRFISKGRTAFKLHIHLPDDTISHHSIGFIRQGEKKALAQAIRKRNALGNKAWGKHWHRVLHDKTLITKLPHSLEPLRMTENGKELYRAMWNTFSPDGKCTRHCMKRSVEKHGALSAYKQCKDKLLDVYKDYIPIISYMDRFNVIRFK
ncbi:hypothetical protein A134_23030 [Vibrio crassostreae 9CS106]|uniref:Fe3+-citrate ABC transporter substrate-binding protein n=1 Tax=Vibrio crassostreae 9CS106 TaxID=1191300 RepID=A0A1B1C3A9_9VIBR|nr:hypothetical protein A134_23030 [Vibrio crassostreae 9CS106]